MDSNATLDLERDLLIAEAIVAGLDDYLLSDILYWPLCARQGLLSSALPRGTLGGLLLRLHRLDALQDRLTDDQRRRLEIARSVADEQFGRWAAQTEAKAVREMASRLHIWGAFLEEYTDRPRHYHVEYPTQAEGRTVLELLLAFAAEAAERHGIPGRLLLLDQRLRDVTVAGDFVWAAAMRNAFPPDRFWWLYVSPRLDRDET